MAPLCEFADFVKARMPLLMLVTKYCAEVRVVIMIFAQGSKRTIKSCAGE